MIETMLLAQIVLLFVSPIAVGFWLKRRLHLSWILFMGGALAFVVSWIITIFVPLPAQFGLLVSSVAQMGILYLNYRYLLPTVKTEREALMVGAGLGGIELMILALIVFLPAFTQMQSLRDAPEDELISLLAQSENISEEDVEQADLDELHESINDYWDSPWYEPLLFSIPSLSFLPVQIALSIIVLGALINKTPRSLAAAMALYFLSKSLPVYAGFIGGTLVWIGFSLLFGGIALRFLSRVWPQVKAQAESALQERQSKN